MNNNTDTTTSVSTTDTSTSTNPTVKSESLRRLSVDFISNAEPVSPLKHAEEENKTPRDSERKGATPSGSGDSDVDMDGDIDMIDGSDKQTGAVDSSDTTDIKVVKETSVNNEEEEEEEPVVDPPLTPSPPGGRRRTSVPMSMPLSMGFLASPITRNRHQNIDDEMSPSRDITSSHVSERSAFTFPLSPEYKPKLLPPTTPSSRDTEMFLSPSPNLKSPKLKSPSVSKESNRPIREISNSLRTRLNYAFVKLQNGWVNKTLPELESEFEEQQQQQQHNRLRRTSYGNNYMFGNATSITVSPQPSFKQVSASYTNRFAFGDGDTMGDGRRFSGSDDNIARFRTSAFSSTMSTPGESTPNTIAGGNLFNRPLNRNSSSNSNSAHQAFLKALATSPILKSPERGGGGSGSSRHLPNDSPLRWMSKGHNHHPHHHLRTLDPNIGPEFGGIATGNTLTPVAPRNFTERAVRPPPRFPTVPKAKPGSPRSDYPSERKELDIGTKPTVPAAATTNPSSSSTKEGKPSEVNAVEMLMSLSSPKNADAETTSVGTTTTTADGKPSDDNSEETEKGTTGTASGDTAVDTDMERTSEKTVEEADVEPKKITREQQTDNDTEIDISDTAT